MRRALVSLGGALLWAGLTGAIVVVAELAVRR